METTIGIEMDQVARDTGLPVAQVEPTIRLLEEGNTVPFIARYRKDQTGGLDDEQVRLIQRHSVRLKALVERKQTILKAIQSQGRLTDELAQRINSSRSWRGLEDLYLPFKPKKQTLAEVARRRGLEPLATEMLSGQVLGGDLEKRLADFVSEDNELPSNADVLLGVGHLLAENFIERADLRSALRKILRNTGELTCRCLIEPDQTVSPAVSSTESATREPGADAESKQIATAAPNTDSTADSKAVAPVTGAGPLENETDQDSGEPVSEELPSSETPTSAPQSSTEQTAEGGVAESEEVSLAPPPMRKPDNSAESVPVGSTGNAEADSLVDGGSETLPAASDEVKSLAAEPSQVKPSVAKKVTAVGKSKARRLTNKEQKRRKLEAAYRDYDGASQRIVKIPPYRVLAINRGERAKVLSVKLVAKTEQMLDAAESLVIAAEHPYGDFLRNCLRDAVTKSLLPSLERELRREITEQAEEHAVAVFARNLRKLLLQPPVRNSRVLAIAPGFKSGCTIAALDEFGEVLAHAKIFVVGKKGAKDKGRKQLVRFVQEYQLSVVAIGNGTACREVEQLVADVIGVELKDTETAFVVVNEAGASVYSTSQVGREELPELDPLIRGAISIGRRLLDPLSELVKINPANIGVGLYQHDVKAKHLRESLDAVVEACVNYVGVDVNTASPSLLRYVSGLNQLTARRLYEYRREHGPFRNRQEFKRVTNFGEATFVQAAGFLRISDGDEPLDATWVHPESYELAGRVMQQLDSSVAEFAGALRNPVAVDEPSEKESPEPMLSAPAPAAVETDGTPTPDAPDSLSRDAVPPSAVGEDAAVQPPAGDEAGEAGAEDTGSESLSQASPVVSEPSVVSAGSVPSPAVGEDAAVQTPAGDVPAGETPANVESEDADQASPQAADSAAESGVALRGESEPGSQDASAPTTVVAVADERLEQRRREFFQRLSGRAATLDPGPLADALGVGKWLLEDLMASLTRPGRDPREDLPTRVLRREILKLEDFKPGMEVQGTVVNVVDFGAFVDIGLTDSGLVHISHLANRFIQDPHEAVSVGDLLRLWVIKVDQKRRRVSLTAIAPGTEKQRRREKRSAGKEERPSPRRPTKRGGARRGGAPAGRGKKRTSHVTARKPRRPPKPVRPITEEMQQGTEPMRTFSDLIQYYDKKKEDGSEPS